MEKEMRELFDFLDESVSPFHAVQSCERLLRQEGFQRVEESGQWELNPGGRYYVTRNQSSVIAFRIPEGETACFHMTASHSDSPSFRIKKSRSEGKYYARAEVEGYGGMILSSWLDRPLSFAGRVVVRTPDGVEARLVQADRDIFVIPNLAIHFNREINKGYVYNPQIDLQPVYGGGSAELLDYIAGRAGLSSPEDLLDMDLLLTAGQKAVTVGVEEEYYMSPRIDDLACAWTTLQGFLQAGPSGKSQSDTLDIWCMFDNEGVGSGTRQGAMSSFLPEVLTRIEEKQGMSAERSAQVRSRSLLVSADNAHAIHPNLPAKSDQEFPVLLNGGIVIKYSASQKYTTTGLTAAGFEEICRHQEILVQHFANRADAPGGSTLGNLLSHQLSIPMLDIGLPQLAMHSAVETAGCRDVKDMIKAVRAFYESGIRQTEDGVWRI
jgi:Aspartyl aminopeptidase